MMTLSMNMDFVYIVKDNSMAPRFSAGDRLVLSDKEPLNDGDIGIFAIDGQGVVCRSFYSEGDEYVLRPLDGSCEAYSFPKELWKKVCRIVGKVVGAVKRMFKGE